MFWFVPRWFPGRKPAKATLRRPRSLQARPTVEYLEDRTLPANVFVVPVEVLQDTGHFHRLSDAVAAAGSGGSVTVLPGSVADPATVAITQANLALRGDLNVPGSILPAFDVQVQANGVSFTNLNLDELTINPGFNHVTVQRCTVRNITSQEAASGNGGHWITQNTITGRVSLYGNTGSTATNDVVNFNTFVGFASVSPPTFGTLFSATYDDGLRLEDNIFRGGAGGPLRAIYVAACTDATVARNQISLIHWSVSPFETRGIEILQSGGESRVAVLNNTVSTGLGRGIYLHASSDSLLRARVEGNDVSSNVVGVYYFGGGGTVLNSDLGGGGLGSLGGNHFRTYFSPGTISAAAIVLRNVGDGAVLKAEQNLFHNSVTPATVVFAETNSTVDVTPFLNDNQAFAQALYNHVLGRTGSLAELDYWVSLLTSGGQAAVVNGILRSSEGLGRIVDGFYREFLSRQSDSGRTYWIGLLQAGVPEETVMAGFLTSAEYLAHIDTDYVQSLYRLTLHRTGSAAELAYWNNLVPALGFNGVAVGFTTSNENRGYRTTDYFQHLLHRSPTSADLSYFTSLPGDLLAIEAAILSSREYFTNS